MTNSCLWKTGLRTFALAGLLAAVGSSFFAMEARAQTTDSVAGRDFRQAANEDPTLGDAHWIKSIIKEDNSRYFEGMSVPQRVILIDIQSTSGDVHTLTFEHEVTKSGSHAYDFLTSYAQAVAAADAIVPGDGLMANLMTQACGPEIGPDTSTAQCTSLRTGGNSLVVSLPDTMGTILGDNVDTRIAAYEACYGDRTVTIYGDQPITSGSITFDALTASLVNSSDSAHYTLTWTSSSANILIEIAGHLAVGEDAACAGEGYGAGLGASSITGGSVEFELDDLDDHSLGSQDNHIKGTGIATPFCVVGITDPGGSCDDGIACTVDTCDESADACVHTPDDSFCDNGLYCDGSEICSPTLGCQAGTAPDCSDGVGCTVDACDEASDTCTHTTNDVLCSNGQYCDGSEVCDPNLDCQPGTPPNCADSISCTTDACDEGTDSCTHTPVDSVCSDGQYCNGDEVCDVTSDCQPGTAPSCNDGVSCTVDSCDEVNDICVHAADDSLCDDSQYCNGVETCNALTDCQAGTAPNCDDGVSCTVDSCDETNDQCVNATDDSLCNDNVFCNGVETCDALGDCQAGTAPVCDDGIACTIDSCDAGTDACAYAPDNSQCDDSNPCTDDACVPGVGCQSTSDDSNDCDDGLFCNGTESCVGGTCTPGIDPCDDGIACTTDACDEVADTCTNTPVNAVCDDGAYCNGSETCDPMLGCLAGTNIDCSGLNDQCNNGVCDEISDMCVKQPANDTQPCDDGQFCTVSEVCLGGSCGGGSSTDCSDGVGCTTDSCDEGTDQCVHTPVDSVCDNGLYCDGVETCDSVGDCQPGPGDPCVYPLKCDENNDACVACLTDAQCDDGAYCNGAETCVGTVCQPGVAPNCDDGVGCTVDSCDETADQCVNSPDDSSCGNGQYCDGVEWCDAISDCQPGTVVDCDDAVACTVDACDEIADVCTNAPDDSACDDLLYCTGIETCDLLLDCQAGTVIDCSHLNDQCNVGTCDDGLDTCVRTPANEGQVCDDASFCAVGETCIGGICNGGSPRDCSDGIDCTTDTCDEVNDLCLNAPQDGLCDDGNPCTDDTCDAALGCVFTPNDTNSCDDGLFCNGSEMCMSGLCLSGADPCDDGIACTADTCDEGTDTCSQTADNALCSDGQFCNGDEVCDLTTGCGPGTPPNCDDGIGCTNDSCNETTDSCDNTVDDSNCTNGLYCDGSETCDVLNDCQPGTPPDCSDGVVCTVDECNETTDSCDHTADDSRCSNGQFCDGDEVCDLTLDCRPGTPPNCSDGVGCTVDACDETTDTCTSLADDSLCDNGLYCDGAETCDAVSDCQPGTAIDCSGLDDQCVVGFCDDALDSCDIQPTNEGGSCDDGQFCTVGETCTSGDCNGGTARNCDDTVGCTVDTCDDGIDRCVNTPDHASCDNGLFCDGLEVCGALSDCLAGTPVVCSDSDYCTQDSCSDSLSRCVFNDICGACCLADGTCLSPRTTGQCGSSGGVFAGVGSACAGDNDGDGRDDTCPEPGIPTVSQWGLLVFSLLLLVGAKVYFNRRARWSESSV